MFSIRNVLGTAAAALLVFGGVTATGMGQAAAAEPSPTNVDIDGNPSGFCDASGSYVMGIIKLYGGTSRAGLSATLATPVGVFPAQLSNGRDITKPAYRVNVSGLVGGQVLTLSVQLNGMPLTPPFHPELTSRAVTLQSNTCSGPPPVTVPPTTAPPVTQPPVTAPPTTQPAPPTTVPTTTPPTTVPVTTVPPSTTPPSTAPQPTTTAPPSTVPPTTTGYTTTTKPAPPTTVKPTTTQGPTTTVPAQPTTTKPPECPTPPGTIKYGDGIVWVHSSVNRETDFAVYLFPKGYDGVTYWKAHNPPHQTLQTTVIVPAKGCSKVEYCGVVQFDHPKLHTVFPKYLGQKDNLGAMFATGWDKGPKCAPKPTTTTKPPVTAPPTTKGNQPVPTTPPTQPAPTTSTTRPEVKLVPNPEPPAPKPKPEVKVVPNKEESLPVTGNSTGSMVGLGLAAVIFGVFALGCSRRSRLRYQAAKTD